MPNKARNVFKSFFGAVKRVVTVKPIMAGAFIGLLAGVILLASPLLKADNVHFNSTRDCDSNAVIKCGAMSVNELQKEYKGSVKDIYDYFDISPSDINNIQKDVVKGEVTKSGNVIVGGKVVATNATTAGREDMPGSKKVTHGGTTFYTRHPSVSFKQNSLDAFVVMKDGVFDFAILASCGNPVSGKAKAAEPEYNLEKQVRIQGESSWKENVNIRYGETVEFKINVHNTGKVAIENINVKDNLPAHLTYVDGSLERDGKSENANQFFGNGVKINRLGSKKSTSFTFRATTNPATQPEPCSNDKVTNTAHIDARDLKPKKDDASVDIRCREARNPDYRLTKEVQRIGQRRWRENVNVQPGTRVRYRIVVRSTGEAPVRNLNVNDQLPANATYVDGTLTRDGNTANAGQFFGTGINVGRLDPSTRTVFLFEAVIGAGITPENCTPAQLRNVSNTTANQLPGLNDDAFVTLRCGQTFTCDLLTVESLGARRFRFGVEYTAINATFRSATFDYGDGAAPFLTSGTTAEHTYAADGTYTVNVSVTFDVNGAQQTVTSEDCMFTLSSTTPPGNCPIPGKGNLPADSPDCEQDVVPGKIANTGPGDIIAIFIATTILGAIAYRIYMIRKLNKLS